MSPARLRLITLAACTAAYVFFIAWYHAPYAGASDASGYLNSARLLLEGRLQEPLRLPAGLPENVLPAESFVPLGFRLDATRRALVPTYPVGLPLHLAAVGWFTGLTVASTVVGVGAALAFAGLFYLVCRECGVGPAVAAGAMALAALSPLTLLFALVPMSDLLASVWALATILCARRARHGPGWAAAAGAALACAVLVRPTNLLLAVPALIALPAGARHWLAFALGGLPGALFLAGYNHALYGAALTTGYTDVSALFSAAYIPRTLAHYARWVPVVASPLVLAAATLPWLPVERRLKWTLAAWAGVLFVFYAAYFCTHETWWYLRFVLPALPALGVAAALTFQHLPAPSSPGVRAVRTAAVLAAAAWLVFWTRDLRVAKIELDDRGYPLAGRWAAQVMPADAVLLAYQVSGSLLYYSDRPFVVPDRLEPPDCARLEEWLARNRRSLYAALYPHEEAAVWRKFPGRWERIIRLHQATIWRRAD
jgi:hypothetical protein